jgi:hypothetical protein
VVGLFFAHKVPAWYNLKQQTENYPPEGGEFKTGKDVFY